MDESTPRLPMDYRKALSAVPQEPGRASSASEQVTPAGGVPERLVPGWGTSNAQLPMFLPAYSLQDSLGQGRGSTPSQGGGHETVGRFLGADLVYDKRTSPYYADRMEGWGRGAIGSREMETVNEGWSRKLEESTWDHYKPGPSTHSSIQSDGVSTPVTLHGGHTSLPVGSIQNGHHRVAAANDINPNMEVPVSWRASYGSGPTDNEEEW